MPKRPSKRRPHRQRSQIWDTPAWRRYATHFRDDVLPQIDGSAVGISFAVSTDDEGRPDFDPRAATELGAMLLLGKPIVLLVVPGAVVPDGLRRAADAVVPFDGSDTAKARLSEALQRLGLPVLRPETDQSGPSVEPG